MTSVKTLSSRCDRLQRRRRWRRRQWWWWWRLSDINDAIENAEALSDIFDDVCKTASDAAIVTACGWESLNVATSDRSTLSRAVKWPTKSEMLAVFTAIRYQHAKCRCRLANTALNDYVWCLMFDFPFSRHWSCSFVPWRLNYIDADVVNCPETVETTSFDWGTAAVSHRRWHFWLVAGSRHARAPATTFTPRWLHGNAMQVETNL